MAKTLMDAAQRLSDLMAEMNKEGFTFTGIIKVIRDKRNAYLEATTDSGLTYEEESERTPC